MDSRKFGFIVNRGGGGGKGGKTWDKLQPIIEKKVAKGHWKVEVTKHSGHASDLAGQLINEGFNVIVAIGGDGTISQVVHGYMLADGNSKGCSIGIISSGTGGDFIRSTKTPTDAFKALDVILNNQGTLVDVGHVKCTKVDSTEMTEQYFINICSVGISGSIIKSVASSPIAKYVSGGLVYWLYTYLTGLVYSPPPVKYTLSETLTEDQAAKQEDMKLYIMAVANGTYLGGNMKIAPKAELSDGKFDVVCLHDLTLIDAFFKASPALKSGDLMALPARQAFTQKCAKVAINPVKSKAKIYVEADGEVAGVLPAEWKIVPNGCQIILPSAAPTTL